MDDKIIKFKNRVEIKILLIVRLIIGHFAILVNQGGNNNV